MVLFVISDRRPGLLHADDGILVVVVGAAVAAGASERDLVAGGVVELERVVQVAAVDGR